MASEYLKWKYRDVKPDEPVVYTKKQRRQNWWDYNLKWVILGALALIALGFLIHDMFFRARPDYEIAVVAASVPPEETQDALEAKIAEYGEDLNGDGEVMVELIVYEMNFDAPNYSDPQMLEAATTRLTVDMSSGEVYLVLLQDPEGFQKRFGMLSYLDGHTVDTDAEGYEADRWREMVYRWGDCPVLRGLDLGTYTRFLDLNETQIDSQTAMEGMYVARRGVLSESEAERFQGAERLWQALTRGAVLQEG